MRTQHASYSSIGDMDVDLIAILFGWVCSGRYLFCISIRVARLDAQNIPALLCRGGRLSQ